MGRCGGCCLYLSRVGVYGEGMLAVGEAVEAGYAPGALKTMSVPSIGPVTYNSAETVKMFPGMKLRIILSLWIK